LTGPELPKRSESRILSYPMHKDIAVIGSSNIDLIMKMQRLPDKGETVTNAVFMQTFGGKGANQAVAAARSGSSVLFVNAVGEDAYTGRMLDNFRADKLDLSALHYCKGLPSGHALVMIGENGMNYLSVAPGANGRLTPDILAERVDLLREKPIWILQCEIPEASLRYLLTEVRTSDNLVIWNYAPAIEMEEAPLGAADILVVNEVEAGQLSGVAIRDASSARQAMDTLHKAGVREIVLTLGAQGALYSGPSGSLEVRGFEVPVVDTTAAGDTFCGAMATALAEEKPWREVLAFANGAAALTVKGLGAQASIPYRRSIDAFLAENRSNCSTS